jgi:hypothetical protein
VTAPDERYLDEAIIEIPSEFEVDLNLVVMANSRIAIEGIDHAEQEDTERCQCELVGEDHETVSSVLSHIALEFEDLWKALISPGSNTPPLAA